MNGETIKQAQELKVWVAVVLRLMLCNSNGWKGMSQPSVPMCLETLHQVTSLFASLSQQQEKTNAPALEVLGNALSRIYDTDNTTSSEFSDMFKVFMLSCYVFIQSSLYFDHFLGMLLPLGLGMACLCRVGMFWEDVHRS